MVNKINAFSKQKKKSKKSKDFDTSKALDLAFGAVALTVGAKLIGDIARV